MNERHIVYAASLTFAFARGSRAAGDQTLNCKWLSKCGLTDGWHVYVKAHVAVLIPALYMFIHVLQVRGSGSRLVPVLSLGIGKLHLVLAVGAGSQVAAS